MKTSVFDNSNPLRLDKNYLDLTKIGPEGHLLHLFTTPFYVARRSEAETKWDSALRESIISKHNEKPGGIVADWQKKGLLDWPEDSVRQFRRFLNFHFTQRMKVDFGPDYKTENLSWTSSAWVNVKTEWDWHGPHVHPGSELSFVYYVSCSNEREARPGFQSLVRPNFNGDFFGGMIQFQDPRGAAPYMSSEQYPHSAGSRFYVEPLPGTLIIFPSYLMHLVAPIEDIGLRISIAGNFQNIKYATKNLSKNNGAIRYEDSLSR